MATHFDAYKNVRNGRNIEYSDDLKCWISHNIIFAPQKIVFWFIGKTVNLHHRKPRSVKYLKKSSKPTDCV